MALGGYWRNRTLQPEALGDGHLQRQRAALEAARRRYRELAAPATHAYSMNCRSSLVMNAKPCGGF